MGESHGKRDNIMIPDEQVPLALLPRTGDSRMTVWYAAAAGVCLLLMLVLGLCWKKEKRR